MNDADPQNRRRSQRVIPSVTLDHMRRPAFCSARHSLLLGWPPRSLHSNGAPKLGSLPRTQGAVRALLEIKNAEFHSLDDDDKKTT
jgi:hypothetical protein